MPVVLFQIENYFNFHLVMFCNIKVANVLPQSKRHLEEVKVCKWVN